MRFGCLAAAAEIRVAATAAGAAAATTAAAAAAEEKASLSFSLGCMESLLEAIAAAAV